MFERIVGGKLTRRGGVTMDRKALTVTEIAVKGENGHVVQIGRASCRERVSNRV